MHGFDLVEKLKAAQDQVASLEGDLKAFIISFIETHRKFKNGQKVEVFGYSDESLGVGFVEKAWCEVSWKWGFNPDQYIGKEDEWLKDLSQIHYKVVKIKKDGTPSTRELIYDWPRQEKIKGCYYLKAVE
jgi:hypothetical protein